MSDESYRHRQMAKPMLLILPLVLGIPAYLLAGVGAWFPLVLVAVVAVALGVLLGSLTVVVDDSHVRLWFGVGVIKKAWPLSGISDPRIVRNAWYSGTGIRMIGNGWLYNVSGPMAVELRLGGSEVVRIGTDEPEQLVGAIRAKLAAPGPHATDDSSESSGVPWRPLIAVPAILLVPVMLFMQGRPPTVTADTAALDVRSMFYHSHVATSDIVDVTLSDTLPSVAGRSNGFALGSALRGEFRLKSGDRGMLYVTKGRAPYVMVRTRTSFVIVNFDDPARTRELAEKLGRRPS